MTVSLVPNHGRWAFPAGSASLAQYQFVALNGSGQLITPAAAGVFAMVLDDAPSNAGATLGTNGLYSGGYTVGRNYGVVFDGVMKVIAGGTIAAGVAIKTDTSGHAVASSTSGDVVLGWTLGACVSGDLVSILLDRAIHN